MTLNRTKATVFQKVIVSGLLFVATDIQIFKGLNIITASDLKWFYWYYFSVRKVTSFSSLFLLLLVFFFTLLLRSLQLALKIDAVLKLKILYLLKKGSSALFIKVQALRHFKKTLQHRCFPVKFAKYLRTPILKNICERLLLFSEERIPRKTFFRKFSGSFQSNFTQHALFLGLLSKFFFGKVKGFPFDKIDTAVQVSRCF